LIGNQLALLQQSAAPPGDAGHGGRSTGSRRDWYGEAHAPGEVQPTPGVEECVLRATRRDEPDQRVEALARPLLGGGAPAEHLLATPRTDCGSCLPYGGGSVDPAVQCEKGSRGRVQLARAPATHGHADSLEQQAVVMDVDDPHESSGKCAAPTSELGGEAAILEEDAFKGVGQASEAL
jgi:hypothetical protein